MPVSRSALLVDDHPIVRQGIARVLTAHVPELRLSEASDAASALACLAAGAYDLVLLDLTLPDEDGLSLLRRIRADFPRIPVLVVSMHAAEQFAERALQGGAAGYLTKDADPQELVRAVRTLLEGRWMPARRPAEDREQPHDALSHREYQVLRMIGAGRTVSEIATELGLSVKTVSTYRSRVLEKLQLRTTAELMHYALVNKLVA